MPDHLALHHLLRSRRSVRTFLPRSVPPEVLERILETATFAPSAHNRQPWRFVVLTTPEAKARLVESLSVEYRRDLLADGLAPREVEARLARSGQRILDAPVSIVLCLDTSVIDPYPDAIRQQAEHSMGVQGVALAGGMLLLAAHAEGLGGVWLCAPLFAQDSVNQGLDLPDCWQPQGLLLLGYPAQVPAPRARKAVAEVSRFL